MLNPVLWPLDLVKVLSKRLDIPSIHLDLVNLLVYLLDVVLQSSIHGLNLLKSFND